MQATPAGRRLEPDHSERTNRTRTRADSAADTGVFALFLQQSQAWQPDLAEASVNPARTAGAADAKSVRADAPIRARVPAGSDAPAKANGSADTDAAAQTSDPSAEDTTTARGAAADPAAAAKASASMDSDITAAAAASDASGVSGALAAMGVSAGTDAAAVSDKSLPADQRGRLDTANSPVRSVRGHSILSGSAPEEAIQPRANPDESVLAESVLGESVPSEAVSGEFAGRETVPAVGLAAFADGAARPKTASASSAGRAPEPMQPAGDALPAQPLLAAAAADAATGGSADETLENARQDEPESIDRPAAADAALKGAAAAGPAETTSHAGLTEVTGSAATTQTAETAGSAQTDNRAAALDARQLVSAWNLNTHSAGQTLTVRLNPDVFGPVSIRLDQSATGLSARIETESREAWSLLSAQRSQLEEALMAKGFSCTHIDIVLRESAADLPQAATLAQGRNAAENGAQSLPADAGAAFGQRQPASQGEPQRDRTAEGERAPKLVRGLSRTGANAGPPGAQSYGRRVSGGRLEWWA